VIISYCVPSISHNTALLAAIFLHGAMLRLCVVYIVFPLTILFFALHETMSEFKYHYFSWLGEISYSSYLLHFPLQLFFALAVVRGFLPISVGNSPLFLLVYGGILILLSLIVFRGFELPVQRMLRRNWRILSNSRRLPWNQHA
jgi:peptidoglycan/LPS O-acetylase OafA/YrhL